MKRSQHIIWSLFLIFLGMGCIEKFEADLDQETVDGLVIEGNIISDSTVVFQLSRTLPLQITGENSNQLDNYLQVNANLCVKGSDHSAWQALPIGNGKYLVSIGKLNPDTEYHVEISYNGNTYQSIPQKPLPCSGIELLSFKQPQPTGPVSIYLNSQETDMSEPKYYQWYYEEDWEVHARFVTYKLYDPNFGKDGGVINYEKPPVAQGWCYKPCEHILLGTTEATNENRIQGQVLTTIGRTESRFSCLYSIRLQQRNLSREEYEYHQVRNKLNSEMGGLFTPQPTELPTNITCSDPKRKVIGYVGCNMGVAYKQLYISAEQVNYVDDYNCDAGDGPTGTMKEKYTAGYQIAEFFEPSTYVWAKQRCVDVRSLGGNPMGRPSWWPNPYIYQ